MENCIKEQQFKNFLWIDIARPDKQSLMEIAQKHRLDYFLISDSLQPGHLPKFEKHHEYFFLIMRAFTSSSERDTSINEISNKIAFFYNKEKLITVHRSHFHFLEKLPKEYTCSEELLIYILHKMVDTFQAPLHELDSKVDHTEKSIFLSDVQPISLEDLYYQKTQTRVTKKLLNLTQQAIQQIEVEERNKTAMQDIKDHLLSLIVDYDEVLESSNHLLNTYLSVNAQKSNDVMKLLTIFSAFFLPLTFIAGIYGMNFEFMPELHVHYAYYLTIGAMVLVCIFIFVWFKRKKIL